MFGSSFQPAPQPRLEPIDGFARGGALDLGADEPAVHVEIALRDHGSLHRRIGMPGQLDAGVQHRSVGEPRELADLAARVLGRAGQPTMRRHVDVEDGWKLVLCRMISLLRRGQLRARAKGHRAAK